MKYIFRGFINYLLPLCENSNNNNNNNNNGNNAINLASYQYKLLLCILGKISPHIRIVGGLLRDKFAEIAANNFLIEGSEVELLNLIRAYLVSGSCHNFKGSDLDLKICVESHSQMEKLVKTLDSVGFTVLQDTVKNALKNFGTENPSVMKVTSASFPEPVDITFVSSVQKLENFWQDTDFTVGAFALGVTFKSDTMVLELVETPILEQGLKDILAKSLNLSTPTTLEEDNRRIIRVIKYLLKGFSLGDGFSYGGNIVPSVETALGEVCGNINISKKSESTWINDFLQVVFGNGGKKPTPQSITKGQVANLVTVFLVGEKIPSLGLYLKYMAGLDTSTSHKEVNIKEYPLYAAYTTVVLFFSRCWNFSFGFLDSDNYLSNFLCTGKIAGSHKDFLEKHLDFLQEIKVAEIYISEEFQNAKEKRMTDFQSVKKDKTLSKKEKICKNKQIITDFNATITLLIKNIISGWESFFQ